MSNYTQCPVCAGVIQRHRDIDIVTKLVVRSKLACAGCGWSWLENYRVEEKGAGDVEATKE